MDAECFALKFNVSLVLDGLKQILFIFLNMMHHAVLPKCPLFITFKYTV